MKTVKKFIASLSETLDSFGGYLECTRCKEIKQLSKSDIRHYLSNGWPKCCGHIMIWYTQKQLDKKV